MYAWWQCLASTYKRCISLWMLFLTSTEKKMNMIKPTTIIIVRRVWSSFFISTCRNSSNFSILDEWCFCANSPSEWLRLRDKDDYVRYSEDWERLLWGYAACRNFSVSDCHYSSLLILILITQEKQISLQSAKLPRETGGNPYYFLSTLLDSSLVKQWYFCISCLRRVSLIIFSI